MLAGPAAAPARTQPGAAAHQQPGCGQGRSRVTPPLIRTTSAGLEQGPRPPLGDAGSSPADHDRLARLALDVQHQFPELARPAGGRVPSRGEQPGHAVRGADQGDAHRGVLGVQARAEAGAARQPGSASRPARRGRYRPLGRGHQGGGSVGIGAGSPTRRRAPGGLRASVLERLRQAIRPKGCGSSRTAARVPASTGITGHRGARSSSAKQRTRSRTPGMASARCGPR